MVVLWRDDYSSALIVRPMGFGMRSAVISLRVVLSVRMSVVLFG